VYYTRQALDAEPPKQQPVPLILLGILIAAILAFFAVTYSTHQPIRLPPVRSAPTPIPLTSVPGARNEEAINCYLAVGERWTPLQYHPTGHGVYVLVRTAGGCYGWMRDPG
jgi:hypothetical protein